MSAASPLTLEQRLAAAQALHQQGQLNAACERYEEILAAEPGHFAALNALGVISGQTKQLPKAVEYFERAIAARPEDSGPHCNRGLALKQLRRFDDALDSFSRAVALNPQDPITYYSLAETYRDLSRTAEALENYDKALAINPAFVQGQYRRALLLQQVGQWATAIEGYERVIAARPDHADAHANRAYMLFLLRQYPEALSAYEQALALRPDDAVVHLFHGNALKEINRREDAVAAYGRAIALNPNYAEAYANCAIALLDLGRADEALASYDRAIAVKPDFVEAYFNRAYLLRSLKRFDAAAADYARAAALAPNLDFVAGARVETDLQICDWRQLDSLLAEIVAGIENGRPTSHPFNLLALVDSPRLQLEAARIWVRQSCPPDDSLGPISPRSRDGRLRVAYFSADFREHPTARLMAELIELHDRSRFEIFGFAFGPETEDEPRHRLARAFDRFIDVEQKSSRDIAMLARSLGIDIAIDLGGYTHNNRTTVFALRAAPVQVNYLGYLGSMGADYIDYIIADRTVITPRTEGFVAEKVIYMPDSFQVNDKHRAISDRKFRRADVGLPEFGFVFCCMNTSYKIMPQTFASWMRILKRVPLSVLMLVAGDEAVESNLRAHASRHGIDPRRLVFAPRLPPAEYLARYRTADLFLDTLPYNAGATASDALWAGLPVLTLAGEAFAARIAASLLHVIGLPELVTDTRQAYEDVAVDLATNADKLTRIRSALAANRSTSPLFDAERFARKLEAAYAAIDERRRACLPPDHIYVA
jgi:predicted O-linked N-acetylglucosamine transferase (SPINDLY family)